MRIGAINDYARFPLIAHLVWRERAADHVASEPLTSFGISSFDADAIVYRESGMASLAHAMGEIDTDYPFFGEEIQHLVE